MKKLCALVVCLLLCASFPLYAESYVLDDAGEREFSTVSSTEYDINGEAGVLTFEGKYSTILGIGGSGNCYLDQYVDGSWVRVATLDMLTKDWQSLTYTLDRRATKIKMYTETGAVGKKNFRNVKVTRARYIEAGDINLVGFTSGSGADDVETQTFSVRYSNAAAPLTVSSSNPAFTASVSSTAIGQAVTTADVTVTYDPSDLARHDATITVTDGIVSFTQSVVGLCAPNNIEAGAATFHTLPVTWNAVSGAESYTIQMRNALNEVEAEETVSTPSYTMSGLTPDATYSVRICANYPGGYSSGFASGLVKTDDYIPAPKDFTVGTVFESTPVPMSWSAVDDVVTYSVRIYTTEGALVSETENLTATSTSIDASLDPRLSYEVKLRADYKGFYSDEVVVTPHCVPTPDGLAYEVADKTDFDISWNAVAPDVLYNIVVEKTDGGEPVDDASLLDTTYRVSGLTPGTDYTIKVRVVTDDGATPFASIGARSWELLPPSSIESSAGEAPFSVRIAWSAVEEADAYKVSIYDAGDAFVRDTVVLGATDVLFQDMLPGTYTVKVAAQWSGYTFGESTHSAAVDKYPLQVLIADTSRMYGQENPETYRFVYSGWIGEHTSVAQDPEVVTSALPTSPAGEYELTVTGGEDPWYTFSAGSGVLTVTKAPLHVSVADTSRYYRKPDPDFRLIYEGFLFDDDPSILQQEPIATSNASIDSDFGVYDITLSGGSSDRYEFILSQEPAKLTISQAMTEVSTEPIHKKYGDEPFSIVTNNIEAPLTCVIADPDVAELDEEGRIVVKALGETTLTVSQAATEHFTELVETQIQLIVEKAPLLISVADTSRLYGTANPDFRIIYEGFVNGEDASVLTTQPVVTTEATTESEPGRYEIVPSGAAAGNYEIEYRAGHLTIDPLAGSLTIAAIDTTVYGAEPIALPAVSSPNADGAYTYAIADETVAAIADGKINILAAGETWLKVSQQGSGNYGDVADSVALVVKKARLAVSVADTVRLYKTENPAFVIRYEGFVGNDGTHSLSELPQAQTTAVVDSDPGEYPITLSGGAADNYELVYVEGAKLIVDKLTPLIDTTPIQVVYGNEPVALTSNNPDGVLRCTPADTTVARFADGQVVIKNAGKTVLTVSQDESTYYHASDTVEVELQVDKAMLTVAVADTSRLYREENPAFTFTYSGFVNNDDTTAISVRPVAATEAGVDAKVGEYVVKASGAQSANYDFTYQDGTLFIRQAASHLEMAAVDTLTYGQPLLALPEVKKNNEEQELLYKTLDSQVAVVKGDKLEIVGVGTTSLVALQETSENYLAGSDTVEVIVNKALLSIQVLDAERPYGEPNPAGKLSYTGFVYDDDTTALTVKPVLRWEADSLSPVGVYTVTPEGAEAPNYKFEYHAGHLTINQAQTVINITLPDTAVYGEEPRPLDITSNNTESEIIYAISDPSIVEFADGKMKPKHVGSTMVIAMQTASQNYTQGVSNFFTYVVKKAPLTIAAVDTTRHYREENPDFTLSYEGFVNGDDASSFSVMPQVKCDALTESPVGQYPILVSGAAADNYTLSYRPATLTIEPAVTRLSADTVALKHYGDESFALSVTTNNDEAPLEYSSEDPRVVTVENGQVTIVASGSTNIVLQQPASDNFTAAESLVLPVTVAKRTLAVSVADTSRYYGEANPDFAITYDGFVAGENEENLTQKPVASCAADSSSLGSFPITLSGGLSDNYDFVYTHATLTIKSIPTQLTVLPIDAKTYGDQPFALPTVTTNSKQGAITYAIADTTVATIADGLVYIKGAGETSLTVKQAATDSHTAAEQTLPLTVSKATLTVTADNKECFQGQSIPELTFFYSGFAYDDDTTALAALPEISCEVSETSEVGEFDIVLTGGKAENYTFEYKSGTLSVWALNPTELIVTGVETKTYGDQPFALPAVTSNNKLGEITYIIADTTVATIAENLIYIKGAGETTLTVKQEAADIYTAAEQTLPLTVSKATLTVTADNKECFQGQSIPELTFFYSGFAYDDDTTALAALPEISCEVSETSEVGEFDIVLTGGKAENYTFEYKSGTLSVWAPNHTRLTVAEIGAKTYGDLPFALPEVTSNSRGELSYAIADTTVAVVVDGRICIKHAGETTLTVKQAATDTHVAAEESVPLVVAKATLTVTADNQECRQGAEMPELTYTYKGFVLGETDTVLTTRPQISCEVTETSEVGEFEITFTGGEAENYAFEYVPGTLSVMALNLTQLTVAEIGEKTYGDLPFALPVVTSNNSRGEMTYEIADTTVAEIADGRIYIKHAGETTLTVKQSGTDSYTAAEESVPLVVAKATLTLTADNQECRQGDEMPELTYTCVGFVNGDDESVFTQLPEIACEVSETTQAGTYLITLTGGEAEDYLLEYKSGVLNIGSYTETILTVAEIGEKTYGDLPFALPVVTSNNSRGEMTYEIADTTVAEIADGRIYIKHAGETTLTVKQSGTDSYTAAEESVPLVVAKATLTLTADNQECRQGDEMPELTYTCVGFVNGDDERAFTQLPEIACEVSETTQAGTYLITLTGGEAENYDVTCYSGTLTIGNFTETVLTVAEIAPKAYNDLPFALPVVTSNNNRGEITYEVADANVALIANGRIYIHGVGETSLIVRQAATSTFSSAEVSVPIVVSKATLTVIAENKSCCEGDMLPELTIQYKGFAMGEDQTSLDVVPQITCEALDASSAGEYDITVSGGVSEHYDFVYQSGTLTVTALSDMPWVATDGTLVYYAQGNLHVSAGVGRLLISDLSGAEVKRVIAPRSIVSLDELPAGQYIVVVESDDRSVSRYRFIKK